MEAQENVRRVAKLGLTAVRRAGSAALPVVRRLAEPLQRRREEQSRRESQTSPSADPPRSSTTPAAQPAAEPAKDGPASPPPVQAATPAAAPAQDEPATPAPPPGADTGHVDREATLVRASADPGAADHVGAQIRIDEPWDGYEELRAVDVVAELSDASAEKLAVVRLYEAAHRNRVTVIDAVERRLAAVDSS